MNTIQEIPLQNQQDFWSMLYLSLGKSVMEICGRRGEAAIRTALQSIAEEEGHRFRAYCLERGGRPNLSALYQMGCGCARDPRMRSAVLEDQEQMRIWEVYTCPMANLWLDAGQSFLANLYCEENQLGLMAAYTGGKGQFHLTKKLTCRRDNGCRADNYCRFSAYYRAANVDEAQRAECFSPEGEVQPPLFPLESPEEALARKSVQLVCRLAEKAKALFGQEGLCAVSQGLRALVQPTAELLMHNAAMTLSGDLERFVEVNLPAVLDPEGDAWARYGSEEGRALFQCCFAVPLKQRLGL
ncbi:MAG: hypothetical protein HFF53_09320 [Lawsonibacter sp.]|nr:hypothetical protein [Lawsonibacter sp.]